MVIRKPSLQKSPVPYYPYYIPKRARRQPFTLGELRRFLTTLSQTELVIALTLLVQGATAIGFWDESEYLNFCGAATLCGFCSLFGASAGIVTLRWPKRQIYVILHLILSIVSAVSSLLFIITTSIWIDKLGRSASRTYTLLPFWISLLLGVSEGVCFILTAVFICQTWQNRRQTYSLSNISQMFEPILTPSMTHLQSPVNNAFVDTLV